VDESPPCRNRVELAGVQGIIIRRAITPVQVIHFFV
jgi:hypothetical protein